MTTKEAPIPIPTYAPVDIPEFVTIEVVPDDVDCPAEPVGVKFEGVVVAGEEPDDEVVAGDEDDRSVLCQLICTNGA
jgi:hypothetical protein